MVHTLDELLMIVENIFLVEFLRDRLIYRELVVRKIDVEEFVIHIDLLLVDRDLLRSVQ